MSEIHRLVGWLHTGSCALSRLSAIAAGIILLAMTGHIIFEIILRVAFSTSTFILDEIVGYGVAATTFLAMGYALERGGLIRVNLLLKVLGETSFARRIVEVLGITLTLAVIGFQIRYLWRSVARNWDRGAVSETVAEIPLWIPEGLMLIGLIVFWLHIAVYLLRVFTGMPLIREGTGGE